MASAAQLLRLEENKTKGNVHFENGEYLEAIKCYTTCLGVCEKAVFYTNRALCYLKLSKPRDAQDDCNKALKLESSNIKALYRKALASKALQRYSSSLWNLKAVLNLDTCNIAAHKEYLTVVDMWKSATRDLCGTQPSGEEFELRVFLTCTSNQTMSKKSVVSRKDLETISDIKQLVEEQHNIPASMQTLEYESHVFDDNTLLRSLGIRSGDTVQVKYSSEADCRAVEEMAVWLFEVVYYLMKGCPSVNVGVDTTLESLLTLADFLCTIYFNNMLDTRCCANMHHFVHHKGLHVLMEILTLIQTVSWSKCIVELKILEQASLCMIQKFILHYSQLILECKGLECCITSLMHVRLEKHCSIEDLQSPMQHRDDDVLAFVMVRSVEIICGLCEHCDSIRQTIASNPPVLQQVLNISTAVPTERQLDEVGVVAPQVAMALLLGMSYSVATHMYLTNHALIKAIMECSRMERPWCRTDDSQHVLPAIKYLSSMLLAQLILLSLKEIQPSLYQPILSFMEEFLLTSNYIDETMQDLTVWTTLLPYVRLLYTQDEAICRTQDVEIVSALKLSSLQIVLFRLHDIMLMREDHCRVIVDEGLLDFIVCLPSYVPETLRPNAWGLIQLLSSEGNIAVHPPRLINLAKAKLAKMYFGLEFVLSTPVSEIVNKVLIG